MILYRLRCAKGHEFDSWFKDSKTYERQEKRSLVGCAVCGTDKVERALMAPRIGKNGKDAALLCYEDPGKPADWCHRGQVSAWFKDTLGIDVFEYGHEAEGCGHSHPKLFSELRR